MKVLWLSNISFSDSPIKSTGSWLQPLAEQLQTKGLVEIINVAIGNVIKNSKSDVLGIEQWHIPIRRNRAYGQIACKKTCIDVRTILEETKPDIVHIWGTESFWASIYRQGYIRQKTLIDIQGLLSVYTDYYYGGLTFKEIFQSVHLKEVLMPYRALFFKKRIFRKRGIEEIRCLKSFKHISYQSEWVKNHVSLINTSASYHATKIMLRKSFYEANNWEYKQPTTSPIIFSSSSAAVSYKGLHILIEAIAILKKKYPLIQLRIAGTFNVGNKLLDGYSKFLNKLIQKYHLQENIFLLGSLSEHEIISQLTECNVCVIPSFIETYCLALAEAMIVGVPTVVSYAGAMPEFAKHNEETLFYNSIDIGTCAAYIDELIEDKELAVKLSQNARKKRKLENNIENVIETQLTIYKSILGNDYLYFL